MLRPRGRPRLRLRTALAATAVACVVAAGCGGSGHAGSTPTTGTGTRTTATGSATLTTSAATGSPPRRRRPRPRGAPPGATLAVHAGSSVLHATVTKVLDPLAGTGSALLRGTRAAGVQVAIRVAAGATYDSTASGDWSLMTTSGQASPLFVRHGICQTPLTDFESLIGVGQTRTGCVAFSVPRRARIVSVRFSPHSRRRGRVAWR